MIHLFHGSNIPIEVIDFSFCHKGKDFGRGFYLSDNLEQAEKMAKLVTYREEFGEPTVSSFMFDESCMTNGILSVKRFDSYNAEWANFIIQNRTHKQDTNIHSYDIIYGPIANDTVGVQIRRFMQQYIDVERLIEELKYIHPTFQYYFGTETALQYLKKIK